jgi:predicted nucleotidyltransferase
MTEVPQYPEKIIAEMVRRIVEKFSPEKIILFGSYARGEAGKDSDVDLLVILPFIGPKRKKMVEIRICLAGLGPAKDVIVATPEEVANRGNQIGTILRPALAEGKVLYEHPS